MVASEAHVALPQDESTIKLLEPIDPTPQSQVFIRTRTAMFIPFCPVEHVFGEDFTPWQIFESLEAAVESKGMQDQTKVWLDS